MIKITDNCCGCSACAAVCPKNCVTMSANAEGFLFPEVNKSLCVDCGHCDTVCPLYKKVNYDKKPLAYGAKAKDDNLRLTSSSGGVFTLFANEIVKKGGVVFGAAFNEKFTVEHSGTDTTEGVVAFRGSKYLQSDMGECFRSIKKLLTDGRFVYFSGTPCQVAGLKAFLGKEYDTLFTQDVICHSVTSPAVWTSYIIFKEHEAGGKLNYASFRAKEKDVKHTGKIIMRFDNGRVYEEKGCDPYRSAFIAGMTSRKSCYDCAFKGLNRVSDITLGDYWGVADLCPELDDLYGTSLIILQSEKGAALFDSIKNSIEYKTVDINDAVAHNKMAVFSMSEDNDKKEKMWEDRQKFFKNFKRKGFIKAYKKTVNLPVSGRIKLRLRKLFK